MGTSTAGLTRGAGGADLDAPANTARWICTRALHLRSGPGRSGEMWPPLERL